MSEATTGVLGLGAMGARMAAALADASRPVVAFDVAPAARDRIGAAGIAVADSVAQAARGSDVLVLSLPTPGVVLQVVEEIADSGTAGTVLDTSTIDGDTAQEAAELLAGSGWEYADCPVLGRPEKVGAWTIPVGGSAQVAATAADVLAPLAARVVRVGDVGAASTLKVLNNLMLGTINAVTAELLVLAEAAGLDPGVLVDVVVDSGAASVSPMFRDIARRAVDGDFDPVFTVRLMHKDNALAVALAERLGVPLFAGRGAQQLNTMALEAGLGDEDSIAVVKALEGITGLQARRHAS